jgi:hypothetical protein
MRYRIENEAEPPSPACDQHMKEPTLKNMLLAQIGRLDKSRDDLDRQLRTYLINVIKDRNYPQDSWIGEIEEVEQVHRLVKNGETVNAAAAAVAKQSNHSRVALQKRYEEYRNALMEIDQIFQEPPSSR